MAEAETSWIFVGTGSKSGKRVYVKDIRRFCQIATFTDGDKDSMRFNCSTGELWMYYPGDKSWNSLGFYTPNSMGEATYGVVCLGHRPQPD